MRIEPALRADVEQVEKAVADRSATLLDSRGLSYFEGREKSPQAMRAGRLPGAAHLDQAQAYDASRGGLKARRRTRAALRGGAGRRGGELLQHRPGRGDELVRDGGAPRPQGSTPLRRFDVGVDARREAAGRDGAFSVAKVVPEAAERLSGIHSACG